MGKFETTPPFRYTGFMLTKNDLSQIRGVIREEIEAETDNHKAELKLVRMEISNRITDLSSRVKNLDLKLTKSVSGIAGDIAQIKKDVKKIQKDVAAHANYFDKEYLELKSRAKIVEDRLGISPLF